MFKYNRDVRKLQVAGNIFKYTICSSTTLEKAIEEKGLNYLNTLYVQVQLIVYINYIASIY